MSTLTPISMPVAATATARVMTCSHAFASHAWSAKAIKANSAYGVRRLGTTST